MKRTFWAKIFATALVLGAGIVVYALSPQSTASFNREIREKVKAGEKTRYKTNLCFSLKTPIGFEDVNSGLSFSMSLPFRFSTYEEYTIDIKSVYPDKIEYDRTTEKEEAKVESVFSKLPSPVEGDKETKKTIHQVEFLDTAHLEQENASSLMKEARMEKEELGNLVFLSTMELPLLWLKIPPLKQGAEVKVEWANSLCKLLGIKPPIATIRFVGISQKGRGEVLQFKVSLPQGSLRLFYDTNLGKFTELRGTFEADMPMEQSAEKGEVKKSLQKTKVEIRNILVSTM